MWFDQYCFSVTDEQRLERTCSICSFYFPCTTRLKEHNQLMHQFDGIESSDDEDNDSLDDMIPVRTTQRSTRRSARQVKSRYPPGVEKLLDATINGDVLCLMKDGKVEMLDISDFSDPKATDVIRGFLSLHADLDCVNEKQASEYTSSTFLYEDEYK